MASRREQRKQHKVSLASSSIEARKDRALGVLLGCAVGDALGLPQERFVENPNWLQHTFEQVWEQRELTWQQGLQRDYLECTAWAEQGFELKPGDYSDDTSMMLCLADSILAKGTIDIAHLVQRSREWWQKGANACNGKAVGLGANTQEALDRFDTAEPDKPTGGTNPDTDAGNGAIMRLAPVPVYWANDLDQALAMARKQSQTTHNVPEALDCCALMAFFIWHALNGAAKATVFGMLVECPGLQHEAVWDLAALSWRVKCERDIITLPGRCCWTLEAALWCLYHTDDFESALIKAINLRGDADTVGAVTGQLAGALYGYARIPERWQRQRTETVSGHAIADKIQELSANLTSRW